MYVLATAAVVLALGGYPRIETVARGNLLSQIFCSFEANKGLFSENEREIWPKWLFRSRFFYSRTTS